MERFKKIFTNPIKIFLWIFVTSTFIGCSDAYAIEPETEKTSPVENEIQQREEKAKEFKKMEIFPFIVAMAQFRLWQFGYYGGPPITGKIDKPARKALLDYQRRRGLKVTGDLDFETSEKLGEDSKTLDPTLVILPSYHFFDHFWDSYFTAQGTWIFEEKEEKMGEPLQTSKIKCYRELGHCFEAIATFSDESGVLSLLWEPYEVERWDDYEIVTRPYDYQCKRYTLRINRPQKTVKKLRTTLKAKEECKGVTAKDFYLHLIDGKKVSYEAREQNYKAHRAARSLFFQELMDGLKRGDFGKATDVDN